MGWWLHHSELLVRRRGGSACTETHARTDKEKAAGSSSFASGLIREGKRHRLMAKRLIDLCFIEFQKKKNPSEFFVLRSEKLTFGRFHQGSKAFPTPPGSDLRGSEWLKENVGKLSAGHSGSLFSSSPCVMSVGFVKMGLRRCV